MQVFDPHPGLTLALCYSEILKQLGDKKSLPHTADCPRQKLMKIQVYIRCFLFSYLFYFLSYVNSVIAEQLAVSVLTLKKTSLKDALSRLTSTKMSMATSL
jgi:hypothetical protein